MISETGEQCADSVLCEDISLPHSGIHGRSPTLHCIPAAGGLTEFEQPIT